MPNDEKYGNVYPEKAIDPLVKAAREMARQGNYPTARRHLLDAIETFDRERWPEDEPIFVLRGQDILASGAVSHYADLAAISPKAFVGDHKETVAHLRQFVERMEAWQPRDWPD